MARVSWYSGTGSCCSDIGVLREACVASGGVGDTTSSRHSYVGLLSSLALGFEVGDGDSEVAEEAEASFAGCLFILTFWKAWMGRASKNSWATIRGKLSGPARLNVSCMVRSSTVLRDDLLSGIVLTESVQIMGMLLYFETPRQPAFVSVQVASGPQRRVLCVSRSVSLASTM